MSDKPLLGQRVGEGYGHEQVEDYAAALRSVSAARGLFIFILVFSILIQIAAYTATRWGGLLDTAEPDIAAAPGRDLNTTGVSDPAPVTRRAGIDRSVRWVLPLAEFAGRISCGLLAICFLLAANICLSGRLGGVRGSIGAFFWSMVLLALLFPWGRWLGAASGVPQVPGVYFTYDDLANMPRSFTSQLQQIAHYARYLAYPILALLIVLAANMRFGRGYRLARRHLGTRVVA